MKELLIYSNPFEGNVFVQFWPDGSQRLIKKN